MKTEHIHNKLNDLTISGFDYEGFDLELQAYKLGLVKQGKQDEAKQIWIYQTILVIHEKYVDTIILLRNKEYYKAWCELERIEKIIPSLKRHFKYNETHYFLTYIERCVRNLQILFPYKLFFSTEILKKKSVCSVCNEEISIRNFCGHEVGEIYDGEMCYRTVTEADMLGTALVQNPGNKYSVAFIVDEGSGEKSDHYNYDSIDYLMRHLKDTFEFWDIEISERTIKKEHFGNVGRNDECTCGKGKKFKNCCLKTVGEKYPHIVFLMEKPSDETLFTYSTKR